MTATDRRLVVVAMATVYLVWGSTYLGIKIALQSLPPLLSASLRFLVAGSVLALLGLALGQLRPAPPTGRQLRNAALSGALLMGGGNAGVVFAEQRLESGITALIVAVGPLLIALYLLILFREPLRARAWAGLLLGLIGLALLLQPGASRLDPVGVVAAIFSVILWSAGSVAASRSSQPARPMFGSAAQMLGGGLVVGLEGLLIGEPARFHPEHITWQSVAALAYLIVFGSLVAFSAFSWLLRVVHVSVVSTSAYVNPAVAVLLGALVLGEKITLREGLAGAVIIAAVILLVSAGATRTPRVTPVPPDPV